MLSLLGPWFFILCVSFVFFLYNFLPVFCQIIDFCCSLEIPSDIISRTLQWISNATLCLYLRSQNKFYCSLLITSFTYFFSFVDSLRAFLKGNTATITRTRTTNVLQHFGKTQMTDTLVLFSSISGLPWLQDKQKNMTYTSLLSSTQNRFFIAIVATDVQL